MAAAFGSREMVQDASLSPDGSKLAFIKPITGQGSMLMVVDLLPAPETPRAVLKLDGEPNRLGSCKWVGNTRLMCDVFASMDLLGDATYVSRMVSVDAAGGEPKVLELRKTGTGQQLGLALYGGDVIDWNPAEDGHVLVMREYLPQTTISAAGTSTLISQSKIGIGVDLVDTRTLQSKSVEQPKQDARRYISDGYGNVRIKAHRILEGRYDSGRYNYYYRKPDSRDWLPMVVTDPTETTFRAVAVDAKTNLAYGLKRKDGRMAAYSYSLDGSGTETLVYAHPEVDIAGFVRIGRRSRVIGVRYVTDTTQVHYLDADIEKMRAALSRAIPNLPLVNIIDSTEDERKMLIWAGSDTHPGRFFLFDRDAKTLAQLLAVRPDVEGLALSAMKPITYPARDGTMVPGYLTLPPGKADMKGLPAIVMPHGGPESRDTWRFDWMVQFFAQSGYAVIQPNFRGSAGYGEQWFQENGFKSWKTAIGDVNDAGHWMVSNGADPKKLAIFGWSYGGYAALQSNVMEPDLFKAVIAVAPVTDLDRLKADRRNWSDFAQVAEYVGDGPHIEQGSPARNADRFKAKVLMFHGDIDRNVDVGHARLMDDKLKAAGKQSELQVFKNRDHYLEDSALRAGMLRTSIAFLEKAFAAQ
ncbi:dipeptidyl aminopeptidase/acylaminoacyl peptidase [Blastomonas natatoria]|uniref:Dipeptidyl aminopeptidase/acylaminoacyl peptidase n=1 Tax=Blastomonas natatoria TaxID=34015 RepID=A0A2V3VH05_9SPHN|nr:S9 family peptidase [Blastomonas natatoria]PXW79325.1 dipeptidyl aminopeptidase/acylaminoacyl peptidase [Blastomonas natatoria]